MRSEADTVEEYLDDLDSKRRAAISAVRDVVLHNLALGFAETMNWGMISYEIPLDRYPDTYNNKPLQYAALASQKNYMAVYLNSLYADPEQAAWFEERYRASGKRWDVGKSCVRFRRLDDLPLELVGEVIARWTPEQYIELYEGRR